MKQSFVICDGIKDVARPLFSVVVVVIIGLMPPGLCLHYAASGAFCAYVAQTSRWDWKVVRSWQGSHKRVTSNNID